MREARGKAATPPRIHARRDAAQLDARRLDWRVDMERLPFQPWYAEVLRRMPRLNPRGLCIIPLPGIARFALLDYRPEKGRRFCYEAFDLTSMPWGKIASGRRGR